MPSEEAVGIMRHKQWLRQDARRRMATWMQRAQTGFGDHEAGEVREEDMSG